MNDGITQNLVSTHPSTHARIASNRLLQATALAVALQKSPSSSSTPTVGFSQCKNSPRPTHLINLFATSHTASDFYANEPAPQPQHPE